MIACVLECSDFDLKLKGNIFFQESYVFLPQPLVCVLCFQKRYAAHLINCSDFSSVTFLRYYCPIGLVVNDVCKLLLIELQICVWCWHHIMDMAEKDDTEGRCPACRTPYNKEKIVSTASKCERFSLEHMLIEKI